MPPTTLNSEEPVMPNDRLTEPTLGRIENATATSQRSQKPHGSSYALG